MNFDQQFAREIGKAIYKFTGNIRDVEYKHALKFFEGCDRILDVGCGTGGFLEILQQNGKSDVAGIDINPDNVNICLEQGLNVKVGNALDIPFEDNKFDGAYCSHVMHVFTPPQAVTLIKELSRVVQPNGVIAIATVPMYQRFFWGSADVRPYPPAALRGLFAKPKAKSHSAPTIWGLPSLIEEGIWLRRPPLFYLNFQGSSTAHDVSQVLNQIQYFLYLRRYWTFNGYIMKLRNKKENTANEISEQNQELKL